MPGGALIPGVPGEGGATPTIVPFNLLGGPGATGRGGAGAAAAAPG